MLKLFYSTGKYLGTVNKISDNLGLQCVFHEDIFSLYLHWNLKEKIHKYIKWMHKKLRQKKSLKVLFLGPLTSLLMTTEIKHKLDFSKVTKIYIQMKYEM